MCQQCIGCDGDDDMGYMALLMITRLPAADAVSCSLADSSDPPTRTFLFHRD